jgi:biopolymer transport protein ExbD
MMHVSCGKALLELRITRIVFCGLLSGCIWLVACADHERSDRVGSHESSNRRQQLASPEAREAERLIFVYTGEGYMRHGEDLLNMKEFVRFIKRTDLDRRGVTIYADQVIPAGELSQLYGYLWDAGYEDIEVVERPPGDVGQLRVYLTDEGTLVYNFNELSIDEFAANLRGTGGQYKTLIVFTPQQPVSVDLASQLFKIASDAGIDRVDFLSGGDREAEVGTGQHP